MEATLHQMRLNENPFEGILNGTQKIEARLNDEKRQELKIGDVIEFTLRDNPERSFKVKIVELLHFKNFEELYSSRPPNEFGGTDVKDLLSSIYKYYSKEEEIKYGVLGIKLEVLKP